MSATLSEAEKAMVRRHLGFPGTSAVSVYAMGMVIPMQGAFLVESAMDHLTEFSATRIRQLLGIVDGIEQKMLKAMCYLTVESIGNIKMRPAQAGQTATDLLQREYVRWAMRISDELGVPYYPFASAFSGSGGGMNVRVKR